ncbi:glycosyltransferase family 4 protein [Salinibacter ruber]|uniref:glycosyltransferase family 4 protein n=1 Tax=Salinibacter ruber TaxID=146919 RepID=UPI0021689FB7|nr:glycosyltransferase family 4 protein [Salinibacter ruber]MCS3642373.1 glycosyltransferase involved in cell wall biosynthesis [Salinibacter ruber]
MIYLYSDYISSAGGIETYLHALATKLDQEGIPFRVAVAEMEHCSLLDELKEKGMEVYRQGWVPGDRWYMRQRVLLWWLRWQLNEGDWLYCLRQPHPELYLKTVRTAHSQGAKIAASWRLAPNLMSAPQGKWVEPYKQAVEETDAVISVSECTVDQFRERYDYDGPVHVVRYHNLEFFDEPVPMPEGPPWRIGYMGRLSMVQKNLDTLIKAFKEFIKREAEKIELHLYGDGPDRRELESLTTELSISDRVFFHGRYDHRTDLPDIVSNCHFFVYTSRFEGGPCFTLLELLQAGRFVVASAVGGIPDIYKGHPEAGLLIEDITEPILQRNLQRGVDKVKEERIRPEIIRNRYERTFDMEAAHRDFVRILNGESVIA